ncbi:hypothetical protein GGR58DRAFT_475141 [Xylaria digitata]|nr:hypothetical protein GGR58DRAFT_475141 [Xylaria digitata]
MYGSCMMLCCFFLSMSLLHISQLIILCFLLNLLKAMLKMPVVPSLCVPFGGGYVCVRYRVYVSFLSFCRIIKYRYFRNLQDNFAVVVALRKRLYLSIS